MSPTVALFLARLVRCPSRPVTGGFIVSFEHPTKHCTDSVKVLTVIDQGSVYIGSVNKLFIFITLLISHKPKVHFILWCSQHSIGKDTFSSNIFCMKCWLLWYVWVLLVKKSEIPWFLLTLLPLNTSLIFDNWIYSFFQQRDWRREKKKGTGAQRGRHRSTSL